MAVQIIENWSKVTGIVKSIGPSTEVDGFTVVEIAVEKVESIEGFPNLLSEVAGNNLQVHVPDNLVQAMKITKGNRIKCWVRQAGPKRFFVHREHIIVELG